MCSFGIEEEGIGLDTIHQSLIHKRITTRPFFFCILQWWLFSKQPFMCSLPGDPGDTTFCLSHAIVSVQWTEIWTSSFAPSTPALSAYSSFASLMHSIKRLQNTAAFYFRKLFKSCGKNVSYLPPLEISVPSLSSFFLLIHLFAFKHTKSDTLIRLFINLFAYK